MLPKPLKSIVRTKTIVRSLLLCCALLTTACGGVKSVAGSTSADGSLSARQVYASHQAAVPSFTTMAARVKVEYQDARKTQSMTVSLRMEKDKNIWIKASILGITLAKVLITPDRVSYYETLSNTYFDGDFALLSDLLGTDINFQQTQAILLGQSIFGMEGSDYNVQVVRNRYNLRPKNQLQNFMHSLFLYPENFKVASASLSQPQDQRLLTISYESYQQLEGSYYPSQVSLVATELDTQTRIEIDFRKIDLNVSLNFPFTIPEGYEEIEVSP